MVWCISSALLLYMCVKMGKWRLDDRQKPPAALEPTPHYREFTPTQNQTPTLFCQLKVTLHSSSELQRAYLRACRSGMTDRRRIHHTDHYPPPLQLMWLQLISACCAQICRRSGDWEHCWNRREETLITFGTEGEMAWNAKPWRAEGDGKINNEEALFAIEET